MRLLILSEPVPPYHPGGAGKFALNLALALSGLDHQIDIVCVNTEREQVDHHDGLTVHWLKVEEYGWQPKTFEIRTARVLDKIRALHAATPFDVVHDCGGFLYSEAFVAFTKETRVPGISHLLVMMAPYLAETGVPREFVDFFNTQQRLQCAASQAVITTSRAESLFYRGMMHDVPSDIILHNAVHIAPPCPDMAAFVQTQLRRTTGDALLMFAGGRLRDKVKGGDRAIALAKALTDKGIPCRLLTTSAAEDVAGYPDLVMELGRLSEGALSAVLQAADCVLCPSRYEAFGLLAVEAGAFGTPVLASQTGGHFDTVTALERGYLVEDDAWTAPDDDLIAFLQANRANKRRAHGSTIPEPYRFSTLIPQLVDLYETTSMRTVQ